jgi:hypothetical protein
MYRNPNTLHHIYSYRDGREFLDDISPIPGIHVVHGEKKYTDGYVFSSLFFLYYAVLLKTCEQHLGPNPTIMCDNLYFFDLLKTNPDATQLGWGQRYVGTGIIQGTINLKYASNTYSASGYNIVGALFFNRNVPLYRYIMTYIYNKWTTHQYSNVIGVLDLGGNDR